MVRPTHYDAAMVVLKEKDAEIERLQAVNEQDRTAVAEGLQTIFQAIKGREWLRLGRGSYEWDDDRWKDEFGAALDEIWDALEPLRQIAGNLKDCPATQAAVDAARAQMSNCSTRRRR